MSPAGSPHHDHLIQQFSGTNIKALMLFQLKSTPTALFSCLKIKRSSWSGLGASCTGIQAARASAAKTWRSARNSGAADPPAAPNYCMHTQPPNLSETYPPPIHIVTRPLIDEFSPLIKAPETPALLLTTACILNHPTSLKLILPLSI